MVNCQSIACRLNLSTPVLFGTEVREKYPESAYFPFQRSFLVNISGAVGISIRNAQFDELPP
jgi:hypothetical protein